MKKHWRIWTKMAVMSLGAQLSYGWGSAGFLFGKIVRLGFFLFFLIAIYERIDRVAGYSMAETVLFFLTFNLIDIVSMVFFRGVYSARRVVAEGDLDYFLIQPCSPLLRIAGGNVDFLDIATLLPVGALFVWNLRQLPAGLDAVRLAAYGFLVVNGILIALALHILVAALAVRTQELENTIWVYRDLMFLARFPVDVYTGGLRWALTLVIPIGIMVSFPAKALLGALSPAWAAYALLLGAALTAAAAFSWRSALTHYTSVSS